MSLFCCLDNATLITGDLNLCMKKNPRNFVMKRYKDIGFIQLVLEATHIEGGWIDHAYWMDSAKRWKTPELERYSPQ